MASKDLILDMCDLVEKNGQKYVLGVIKQDDKDKSKQNIDIYTNLSENPLSSLLNVLKEHQKTIKNKSKEIKSEKAT